MQDLSAIKSLPTAMHASRLSGWPVWGRTGSGRDRERAKSKDRGMVNPKRERENSQSQDLDTEEVNMFYANSFHASS